MHAHHTPKPPEHAHWHDLVTTHLHLIEPTVRIIARHAPAHVDRDELAQAGTLGLVDAARRYTPTEQVPFAAYALVRIRGAVLDAMRRDDWAPRGVRAQMRDVLQATETLTGTLERDPSVTEIADLLNWDIAHVIRVLADANRSHISSLAATPYGRYDAAGPPWLTDVSGPEQHAIDDDRHAALAFALTFLPDDLATVIRLRFYGGWNLARIGSTLQITDARVAQLVNEAVNLLRAVLHDYDAAIPPVDAHAPGSMRRRKAVTDARTVRLGARGRNRPPHRAITHTASNSPRL